LKDVNAHIDPYQIQSEALRKSLLVVDDEPQIINSIVRSLRRSRDFEILTAGSGPEGLDIINNDGNVAVVLSDQNMPEMDGIRFLEKVREYDKDIVRLLLTGHAKIDDAIEAINRSQIFEYLTKPWEPEALKNTLQRAFDHYELTKENRRLHLMTLEQNTRLRQLKDTLEEQVKERTLQLATAVREGVLMLSIAAEARDDNTGDHVKRIRKLTQLLSLKIGMKEEAAERIGFFSMMHDVGKIHVPDNILNKKGPLSEKQWRVMKEHTTAGEKILGNSPYYLIARQIARSHHEWMDGSGYPDGLKGVKIPLPARIVAVVDVFDALTHERPYKKAWPTHEAVEELKRLAGRQLDTDLVSAFVQIVSNGSIDDF
jgi:putative two-component system response regulator